MSAGKGDTYRRVDGGKYRDNWDKAFGSNNPVVKAFSLGINIVPIKGIPEGEAYLLPDPEDLSTAIKMANFK